MSTFNHYKMGGVLTLKLKYIKTLPLYRAVKTVKKGNLMLNSFTQYLKGCFYERIHDQYP